MLSRHVLGPLKNPEVYAKYGVRCPRGALLYGPPGCSKTMFGRAIAGEIGGRFLSVKGPELVSKYLGESERNVREVFRRVRESGGVVFFDEVDAVASKRGEGGDRLLSQILTEVDGLGTAENVVVIAATNRPDLLDDALIRAGRLEVKCYCGLTPTANIYEGALEGCKIEGVNFPKLEEASEGLTGAEVHAVVRNAKVRAVEDGRGVLTGEDLLIAAREMERGVTEEVLDFYRCWKEENGG